MAFIFDTFSLDTFESYNIDTGAKLKDAESFFIMCALLDNEKKWWSTISSAIELYDPMDINVLLEAVFCISSIPQNHLSWNPLQLVYLKADYSTYPEFYYRYLEIVYLMNQRNNWPIDEKIVLQIYASITVRKFANFPDEIGFPELMSKVSTRLDIPGDTFSNNSCNYYIGIFQDYQIHQKLKDWLPNYFQITVFCTPMITNTVSCLPID